MLRAEPIWPSGSFETSGPSVPDNTETAWKKRGSCTDLDPDIFFAQGRGNLGAIQTAKQICIDTCPVIDDCREYALDENIDHGVWGGLSTHQRAKIRAQRRRAEEREQRSA